MTRNYAEEVVRQTGNLTITEVLNMTTTDLFSLEQQLQEAAATHRGTKLATKARNMILVINGRY